MPGTEKIGHTGRFVTKIRVDSQLPAITTIVLREEAMPPCHVFNEPQKLAMPGWLIYHGRVCWAKDVAGKERSKHRSS